MSASPNSAEGLVGEALKARAAGSPQPFAAPATTGHEALQALLAFSSLHEQIRERRAHQVGSGDDAWEIEQFVLDEVLHLVAQRAMAITGADGVAIALAEGNAIVCRGSAGAIAPDQGVRLDPTSGFSGACFRTGCIVRCDDSEDDPRVNVEICRRLGTRSMVAVPLLGQHGVLGLLEAFARGPRAFTDNDVRSLSLLAELVLAAMKPEEEDRMAEISQQVSARASRNIQEGRYEAEVPTPAPAALPPEPQPEPEAVDERHALPAPLREKSKDSWPGLSLVVLMLVIALGLGTVVWWTIRHDPRANKPVQQAEAAAAQDTPNPAPLSNNKPSPSRLVPALAPQSAAAAGLPQVTGVRFSSAADSTTVEVDLQDQVQYEEHRLNEPERIYFDLHDTSLAPGVASKALEIHDALLLRVRVAQPAEGITRVVLETKGEVGYTASLEQNPYRLVVVVNKSVAPAPKPGVVKPAEQPKAAASPALPRIPESTQTKTAAPPFQIALDAGHGGWDLGTVGRRGLMEKDLVLDIVARLGKLVEKRLGAKVTYTRKDDTYISLEKRAEIANLSQADLFLSIHANYSDLASARGVETYYTNTYSSVRARTAEANAVPQNIDWTSVDLREKVLESRKFAASLQKSLYGTLAEKNPGIRDRGVKEASYVVLTGTTMPAVLAEVSFVSSPADEGQLKNSAYRQQIAEALYKGLARYVTESRHVKIASTSGKSAGQ